MKCWFSVCETISLLILLIIAPLWALIWTGTILSRQLKSLNIHQRDKFLALGLFEFVVLVVIVCIFVRAYRRSRMTRQKREASRILHAESFYGAVQRQQNQLYYIQDKVSEMDKGELKRLRESLSEPQSDSLYPKISASRSLVVHSKVKMKILKTSCTTRSPLLMKIILVGNPAVGKSSLLKRWLHGQYTETYRATLGADFVAANLELESNGAKLPSLSLQAWDIAGQERFASMTHLYYNKAVCFCVVYDISNRSTLQGALWWINDIKSKIENPLISVVANKLDLKDHQKILPDDLAIMESTQGLAYYEVSAKTGENVDDMFRTIVLSTFLQQIQEQLEPTKEV